MEERVGKRVNHDRVEEALRLSPQVIASACPFCMTMMDDGVKGLGAEEKVQTLDIAEVLAKATLTEEG